MIILLLAPVALLAQINDIYFVPTKKSAKSVEQTQTTEEDVVQNVEENSSSSYFMDEDEYNRRYTSSLNRVSADEEYEYEESPTEYSNDSESVTRSYTISDNEDYKYSTRLVRFHSPGSTLLRSPWYWDVVYSGGINNWTIYDDGIYWDIYTDDWYYYSPSWSWGYYSPYYRGWYNSWGYWNNHWYYGYNHCWGHHWHNHYYPVHTHSHVGNKRPSYSNIRGKVGPNVATSNVRRGSSNTQRSNSSNVRRSNSDDNRTYSRPSSTRSSSGSNGFSSGGSRSSGGGSRSNIRR